MQNYSSAIATTYNHVGNFILLGLTGRTGSGCSTAAKLLCKDGTYINHVSQIYKTPNDLRKLKIIERYTKDNWEPFYCIQVTTVITSFILDLNYEEFVDFLTSTVKIKAKDEISDLLTGIKQQYEQMHTRVTEYKALPEKTLEQQDVMANIAFEVYFKELPAFIEKFKNYLQSNIGMDSYVTLYQAAGDNIRASGKANDSSFIQEKLFFLPRVINRLVTVLQKKQAREQKGNLFIVIDAIRNPYEAEYFRQRHAHFYLISVNTPNSERLKHLRESHKFTESQINKLDEKEYPKKASGKEMFISQNIQKCIELADIHLNNPIREKYNDNELANQLYWYIALMKHPGLVNPTSTERGMQLAFAAKLNSGCISRQVGAVITDSSFSIKAVGWNSVPEGQVPCLLRNVGELMDGGDRSAYSEYELNDGEFRKVIETTYRNVISIKELKGRNFSFCFKDVYNEVEGEKNQVHTRSLHAEENAFLQITKYGGGGVKGGLLFTTASPCELCSKKAYQLGISRIIYIDPYPGISNDHILNSGESKPELTLFSGAIGCAYHGLYQSLLPFKDELQMITGYTVSGGNRHKQYRKLIAATDEVEVLKKKISALEKENKELKAR